MDLINDLKIRLGKYTILKTILAKPYKAYEKRCAQKRIMLFQKYGMEALRQFNSCMTEHGYKYQFAFGTLLGAVREKDFIPHDDDLDFTMWIDDYKPEIISHLKEYGINYVKSFSVENDKYAKEDTFEYKGILMDIFYIYDDENKEPYTCYFEVQPGCGSRSSSIKKYGGLFTRKIYLSISKKILMIPFKGIEVPIPKNYDEVLKRVFGDNYMTPIPGWSHKDYSEPKPEWLCIYKELE